MQGINLMMHSVLWPFSIFALLCLVEWSNSEVCPAHYTRFTPEHTFCLQRNSNCDIKRSGVSQKDIEDILSLHNEYRSAVALGEEHRAIGGNLPQAADMLQMVWDDQLAIIAQKWAENCHFDHDCGECRTVENFAVGQNLVLERSSCQGFGCREDTQIEPNWPKAVQSLSEEVLDYQKDWLRSFEGQPGRIIGHFTQVIWSKSWRIGCGYTAFKDGSAYQKFYVCNYGPSGNSEKEPVYEAGSPCSSCPINSCCGSSCSEGLNYPGLCKMLDPNTAPEYRRPSNLFFCGASRIDRDCQASVTGVNKRRNVKSVGGNYDSIVLKGGESTSVSFHNPVVPTQNSFCLVIKFRKVPLDASREDQSSFRADLRMDFSFAFHVDLRSHSTGFRDYRIHLQWGSKTKLGLTFSVARGADQHVLDVREVSAYDGPCDSLKTERLTKN